MLNKTAFIRLATLFEAGLLFLALGLGWLLSIDPLARLRGDVGDLALGLLAVLPLYIPLQWMLTRPCELAWVKQIKQLMTRMLGECLGQCRRVELLYVAALAGIAEEIFFRGLVQTGLEQTFGTFWAVLLASLLFGLVHWVTPGYALMAGAAGVYLGLNLYVGGEPNLLIPMVIHTLYDYLALLGVAKLCRDTGGVLSPGEDG